MDDWEKFNETSFPEKEDFHSHLNMGDITDTDYTYAKRACNDSETKNLGEYQDLYVLSDTLLLAVVFSNFRNMYLEVFGLDPAHIFSKQGLAWKVALIKKEVLTDIDMLLMVEKRYQWWNMPRYSSICQC